jgi:hypothetical protein
MERVPLNKHPLKGTLTRNPMTSKVDKIIHTTDWYVLDGSDKDRQLRAYASWEKICNNDINFHMLPWEALHSKRNSKVSMRDTRFCSFLHDVIDGTIHHVNIDSRVDEADENDIILLTNSDICLIEDTAKIVRNKLAEADCCYAGRVNVLDSGKYTKNSLSKFTVGVGADMFAFRVKWWLRSKAIVPDLLMACEGWDWVMKTLMLETNKDANLTDNVCYHEVHGPFWAHPNNITSNVGQQHNRNLCREWAVERGYKGELNEKTDGPLFKA